MKLRKLFFQAFILASILTAFNFSCEKIKDAIKINVDVEMADVEFVVGPTQSGGSLQVDAEVDVHMDIDSLIKDANSNLSINNLKAVYPKSCTLTLVNPTTQSFGDLESYSIQLSTNGTNWTTIAEITNNPDVQKNTLVIPVNTSADLKPYFTSTNFKYRAQVTGRRAIPETTIKANLEFVVQAGL
ncbi:MAG TPA: hypothetical protein VIK74_05505 [Parasegetibacter sp.]